MIELSGTSDCTVLGIIENPVLKFGWEKTTSGVVGTILIMIFNHTHKTNRTYY